MANAQTNGKTKALPTNVPAKAPRKSRAKAKPEVLADATAQTPKMEQRTEHTIPEEQRQGDRRADDVARNDAFSKFVQQGTAELSQPNQKAFEEALAELKAKHNVTADVVVKPAKASKVMQNGITRPAASTLCGKIWGLADDISAKNHSVAAIASIREHADMKEVNDHTIKTQYAKWRKFHGVSGRLPTIHAVHQEVVAGYDDLNHHVAGTPVTPPVEAPAPESKDAE